MNQRTENFRWENSLLLLKGEASSVALKKFEKLSCGASEFASYLVQSSRLELGYTESLQHYLYWNAISQLD